MSAAGKPSTPPSLGEVTAAAVFAIGLVSAWLYAAGWTYAYHYFDRFGIPLLMVDMPKEHVFVYGGIVVRQFPAWALGVAVAAVILLAMRRWLVRRCGAVVLPAGIIALIALFWLGAVGGAAAAREQVRLQRAGDFAAYPRVQVWRKAEAPGVPANADLTQGCYRLLLHNQDRLFLFRPFKHRAAAELPTLILPWDQVEMLRVLPEYTSCP